MMSPEESKEFIANRGGKKIGKKEARLMGINHYEEKSNIYWDYGNFYFFKYDDKLFNQLEGADLVRVLYLASYMGYTKSGNKLFRGTRQMDKESCYAIMGLKDRAFREFWSKCITFNIIEVDAGGYISLSSKHFLRGNVTKKIAATSGEMIRINADTIKHLYLNTEAREHKRLSYLYRLIPFVEEESNIVHTEAEVSSRVEKLPTRDEFCNMIGYKADTIKKVKELFDGFVVGNGGIDYRAAVIAVDSATNKYRVTVNPLIFYKGDDYKKAITSAFKIV